MVNLTRNEAKMYLLMGVVLTFIPPILESVITCHSFIIRPLLVFGITGVSSVLSFIFINDEKIDFGAKSIFLFIFGASVAIVYFLVSDYRVIRFDANGPFILILSFLNLCVILPFYEELVVRSYLFTGMSRFTGKLFSAIAVSCLFGLIHKEMPFFAFLVSLFLCYLTYLNIGVVNRTMFHGAFNLTTLLLLLRFA